MDSSVSDGASLLQTSQPSMQKKKKSKTKKGSKGIYSHEGLTLETQTEIAKVSGDRLTEVFESGLHLNNSDAGGSKIVNSNVGESKGRKISNSNILANGTDEEILISETCCRQLNGHDSNTVVAPAAADSRADSESISTAEKQNVKKTKRKHKLKNKENAEENCHNIDLVDQKVDTTQQESYEQTLQNGFSDFVQLDTNKKGGDVEGEGLAVLLKTQNRKGNKNIKKEITEVKDKLKEIAVQEDQKVPSQQAKEEQLTITSVPASNEKATKVILTNPKKEVVNALTSEKEIPSPTLDLSNVQIEYKEYESELQMHDIMRLIQAELSEPYSIYTYRYFIYNWPKLCFLAAHGNEYVGAIVCKLDRHRHMNRKRGYIAMLAVRKEYRKLKIGTTLVQKAIEAMLADNADEVVLETEMRNVPALRLYENLGFVRDKRLFRYYLNGVDALRLKLWFR